MSAFSLAKKAFFKPFEKNLIRMIAPAYFILIGIGQLAISSQPEPSNDTDLVLFFIAFSISFVLLCIGPLIFYPILMEGLRANTSKSKFIFPKANLILKKAWKIFIAGIMPTIFVLLGTLCFIIPGIFLAKRYIYVPLIVEKEMIGPIEAMRKSRTLSRKNGWSVLLAFIYCSIPYAMLSIPFVILLDPTINTSSKVPIIFSTLITIIFGWFTTIATNSVAFYGYINSDNKSNT